MQPLSVVVGMLAGLITIMEASRFILAGTGCVNCGHPAWADSLNAHHIICPITLLQT